MPPRTVGWADLLRMTAALPRSQWAAAAEAMGYVWAPAACPPVAAPEPEAIGFDIPPPRVFREPELGRPPAASPVQTEPMLWRIGADLADRQALAAPAWFDEQGAEGCFESDGRFVLPVAAPLLRRSRLARFLRGELAAPRPGSQVDLVWAVARLARLRPLVPLRRKSRSLWPHRLQVVLQTDASLGPLRFDLRRAANLVRRWLGERVSWFECPGGPQRMLDGRRHEARLRHDGSRVVVLGDAGSYHDSQRVQADWLRWARRLGRNGRKPLLLAPLPRRRLSEAATAAFDIALLDESAALRLQSAATARAAGDSRSTARGNDERRCTSPALVALTALLAGLSAVEPALLRLVRRAVRAAAIDAANIAAEVDFVRLPSVEWDGACCRVRPGCEPAAIERWRHAAGDDVTKIGLVRLVEHWSQALSPLLQAERAQVWRQCWPEAAAPSAGAAGAEAAQVWRWLAAAMGRAEHPLGASLQAYLVWLGRCNPGLIGHGPLELQAAWILAHRDRLDRLELPEGLAVEQLAWLFDRLAPGGAPDVLMCEGLGAAARLRVGPATADAPAPLLRDLTGSSRFRIRAALQREEEHGIAMPAAIATHGRIGEPIMLPADRAWHVDVGPRRIVIEPFTPPQWAAEVWRDGADWFAALPAGRRLRWVPRRSFTLAGVTDGAANFTLPHGAWWDDADYRELVGDGGPIDCPPWANAGHGADPAGWWVAFAVNGVRQVMRFVAPGRFEMGSPPTEPGRLVVERLHPVVLTRAFWIADTACTQALWQAVTGANPSRFADDAQCPVETVSWQDVQEQFLDALAHAFPGLHLRLPTEAEWEYAARACGQARTAFHWGERIAAEQANFDGNLGRTLPVRSFVPNALALYQMHGNVFEWVEDSFAEYADGEAVDPLPAEPEAQTRVLRGGSWFDDARNCRSADRDTLGPQDRFASVGFRLARSLTACADQCSQRADRVGVGPDRVREPSERPATRRNVRRTAAGMALAPSSFADLRGRRTPAGDLDHTSAAPTRHRVEPLPPTMLPLPPVFPFAWAVAHGCDRFGLWLAFEVGGVRQRLRWLPPGSFWMGSPKNEHGRQDDELRHRVRLTQGFWLGETVVTQALWRAVLGGENPAQFAESPDHPVEQVSWDDATEAFLPALARALPGLTARLPSEAEWEYACREAGRAEGPFNFGDGIHADEANFDGRTPYRRGRSQLFRGMTTPVDTFAPNALGLREMHGGVWEWCQDWYAAYPECESCDPLGPESPGSGAPERVLRGGSWFNGARYCRSAQREAFDPRSRYPNIGFRLARGPFVEASEPAADRT